MACCERRVSTTTSSDVPASSVRLEDLSAGVVVRGLDAVRAVTVVAVTRHGADAATVTYRDADGGVRERLVYRDDEPGLSLVEQGGAWAFDADGATFRLVSEARRIRMAHLFDPMLAVHLSLLEPLPHQIQAVYGEMLPRQPLRFLLADDPGAGKTVMAGLYVKELLLRGDVARCLVVAPGSLVVQWQDELADKFGLHFQIVTRESVEASRTGNPLAERDLLIARLDHLARNDDLLDRLERTEWDLVVVDEAHRMSAQRFGAEVKETRRYRLGRLLGPTTRHLLLMTATPHAGKEDDFQLFLALLDADRFEGRTRGTTDGMPGADVSDLMRRMVKEKLLRFDGRPLFPERRASTVLYALSPLEMRLYEEVTSYVREEMNRVDELAASGEGRRGNRVGFALTVLQRRLASSPEAIYQSLRRRRERLEGERAETAVHRRVLADGPAAAVGDLARLLADVDADEDLDLDELPDAEIEQLEEALVDGASTARTVEELDREIAVLRDLEALARQVRASGTDRKWQEFSALLEDEPAMRDGAGRRRKLLVFTEHRDTLRALVARLRTVLGRPDAVVDIHGGTGRDERRRVQETFQQDPDCLVLVATDAAGEGVNLQRAHLVVNYDLPWNPNRIEQRFGRVHRIGQTEVCHLWNLVAEDTREGQVYARLLDKLDVQRQALGGQVFDVLGKALSGRELRDLLVRAVRYGDQPDVRARLDEVIDARVGEGLSDLVAEHALASDVLGEADVARIREQMEKAAARRLQPHYIRSFFLEAFARLGGRAAERGRGRYEVTRVPLDVRARNRAGRVGAPALPRYERVCFDKERVHVRGRPLAELVAPGHPLLEATLDLTLERNASVLRRGAVLVDDDDPGDTPRVLVYLEHAVADGRVGRAGEPQVVSTRFEFVEIDATGAARVATTAPYLDRRPAEPDELALLDDVREAGWLDQDLEQAATAVAITQAVPAHLAEVRERTQVRVAKVRGAVHARLTREITHWDGRASELREQAEAGRQPRMNPERAQARADDLAARLRRRMAELDEEEQLRGLPPVVVGGALVVPAGVLRRLRGEQLDQPQAHARDTTATDRRAVAAVLAAEARLGRDAEEMAHNNPGYDIISREADGSLLFIEVKGRMRGADDFTVSRNQILHGLNAADRFILALVEVPPEDEPCEGDPPVRYLRHPFVGIDADMHFAETRRTFDWDAMWQTGVEPA